MISFTSKVETQSPDWHYSTKKGKIYTDLPEARATATKKQSIGNVLNILTLIFEWYDFLSGHFPLYREVVNDLLIIHQRIDRIILFLIMKMNKHNFDKLQFSMIQIMLTQILARKRCKQK